MEWKALLIEDDPGIVEALTLAFQLNWPEANVISTRSGREGIELAETASPDIILLDLGLPDISGFEVLRRVRLFSNTPIIILSVRSDEADIVECLECGAHDYLVKPFRVNELIARVRVRLLKRVSADQQTPSVVGTCL